ncbi:MAG TPA: antitoxin [Actinomycetota bacterium]|nr:antitoxin [Actinomycetota bacterium]
MRTTVTLDPDAEQIVRRRMRERGVGFKEALNDVIRAAALSEAGQKPFRTTVRDLGASRVNLDPALHIAGALEDDDLVAKMRRGS